MTRNAILAVLVIVALLIILAIMILLVTKNQELTGTGIYFVQELIQNGKVV